MNPVMLTDAELLRCYAEEKSDAAFAELVRRHVDLVYSAAVRQVGGDAHRAKDVTQIVFTTLARKAPGLTGHPVLTGWLYTATQHAAAKAVRSEARRHAREQEAHAMHEMLAADSEAIAWDRVRPVLDDAMRELPKCDREAVLLRFFARRPFGEIGTMLNLSEDAARMRVERALDKLHGLLAQRGVTSTSSALAVALSTQAVTAAPIGVASAVTSSALAGAAMGSAGLAGVFGTTVSVITFMSTGKTIGTIAAVVALGAAGFGVYEHQRVAAAETNLVALRHERDALHAQVRENAAHAKRVDDRARELEQRLAAMPRLAEKPRPNVSATPAPAGANDDGLAVMKAKIAQSSADKFALNQLRATDPEFNRVWLEGQRAGFAVRFAPLYRNLNLSAEQIALFEQRLTRLQQEGNDIMAASQAKGVSLTDPAVAALIAQDKTRFEADLRSLLGEQGLREYQRFEQTFGARETVNAMLGNLAYADTPLSARQINDLTQLIAEQTPDLTRSKGRPVNWDGVLSQASRVLSPPQVNVLRAMAEQARATQRMQELTEPMLRKLSPLQPGLPTDPTAKPPKS